MTVAHKLIGYDKRTERPAFEHLVPVERFKEVRGLANVPPGDAEAIGAYPLTPVSARTISNRLGVSLNIDTYDWFLEPAAES